MKRNLILALTLVLTFAVVATYVLAQQIAPATKAGKLNEAIGLLNNGKPTEARGVITNIPPSDPEFGAAQFYDALALSEANDQLGLLNKMEVLKTNKSVVAVQLKEDLAVRELDALFYYRNFDELLTQANAFKQAHPDSTQINVVVEHQLAALFERGMKKTTEACSTKDQAVFNQRWPEGKANLEQFLALAASFKGESYTVIKKHTLSEAIQIARLTLGDENAVLEEAAIQDDAVREKVRLMRVRLYQKLQPEKVDRNLEILKDFLAQFPESQSRKRVEFDIADLSFPLGKQLCLDADAAEKRGDTTEATEKRALARRHFETQRAVQSQAIEDRAAGIDVSDIRDLRADTLYSFYLEKNYNQLRQLSESLIAESSVGEMNWMQGKVYAGIAMRNQSPEATKDAAAIFDEVLAIGFKSRPDHDYLLELAARWRLNLALQAGDKEKAQSIMQSFRDGNCTKEIKRKFLTDFDTAIISPINESKQLK